MRVPLPKKLSTDVVVGGLAVGGIAYAFWAPFLGYSDVLSRVILALPFAGLGGAAGFAYEVADGHFDEAVLLVLATGSGTIALSQYLGTVLLSPYITNQDVRAILIGPVMGFLLQML